MGHAIVSPSRLWLLKHLERLLSCLSLIPLVGVPMRPTLLLLFQQLESQRIH